MSDIHIRTEGRAGRITLIRPQSLNALTWAMCLAIEAALDRWRDDDAVALVLLDGAGDRAFCAGGDVQDLYHAARTGDFAYGQRFWADEYRMNAKIRAYPKPVVSFLHGFTMGGGVGIGCHGSHRIVDHGSRIAMPECSIGLVPDVGGSLLLARAPGRLGEYLGLTGTRMEGAEAIHAGFADHLIPRAEWEDLKTGLARSGDPSGLVPTGCRDTPLARLRPRIDRHFAGDTLGDILRSLHHAPGEDAEFAAQTLATLARHSPLSMGCTVEILHRLRGPGATMARALELEYRFTYRAMEHGDFVEGVRAQIIDKDRKPRWRHDLDTLPRMAVTRMLMPLGADALNLEQKG